jgi:hypothetical protein
MGDGSNVLGDSELSVPVEVTASADLVELPTTAGALDAGEGLSSWSEEPCRRVCTDDMDGAWPSDVVDDSVIALAL